MSRQEPKRLTEELLQPTNPGLSRGKMKDFVALKTKSFPKRFSARAINEGIREQLLNAGNENYLVGVVNAYETD